MILGGDLAVKLKRVHSFDCERKGARLLQCCDVMTRTRLLWDTVSDATTSNEQLAVLVEA